MVKDSLGDRMKKYEYITRTHLVPRMPVIIRIDGKAFHTFTKGFKKPFDDVLVKTMQETMKYLCENIQGCVLGYTQSDEITLILVDYKKLETCSWFDYNIQKCASVAASMATMAFNKYFPEMIEKVLGEFFFETETDDDEAYANALIKAMERGAMFDARCFNVPKEEVCNNILWRQNDATRNSIEMVGHANFSQKQLHKKNCKEIQDMLVLQRGINWNDYPVELKRGSCCIRVLDCNTGRSKWEIDKEIPIFKGEGRRYVEDLINAEV